MQQTRRFRPPAETEQRHESVLDRCPTLHAYCPVAQLDRTD